MNVDDYSQLTMICTGLSGLADLMIAVDPDAEGVKVKQLGFLLENQVDQLRSILDGDGSEDQRDGE